MNRLFLYVLPWLLATCSVLHAQDVHLSQFYETPLLRNPALAGIFTGDVRVQAVYRNQWASVAYPFQTTVLNGEYKFPVGTNDFMTVGMSAFYDVAGIQRFKTLQVMPVLNYHKSLSGSGQHFLSAGFMAGFVQRQFDAKNLTFDNQYVAGRYDPFAGSGENFSGLNLTVADFAAGLSYNSSPGEYTNLYAGVSYWHFNKPKANFLSTQIQLQAKWQANAGIKTWINDHIQLQAEANYMQRGPYRETIGGLLVAYSLTDKLADPDAAISTLKVGAGLLVRLNDAVIPTVRISYNHLDVGLSYDVNTSKLKTASQGAGGYELSLSYRAFTRRANSMINQVWCPKF